MVSDSPDNSRLEALVKEYFTGNDDITDAKAVIAMQKVFRILLYLALQ